MSALWFWELEPGKDYWLTLRDWMLYCARRPHPFVREYPEFFKNENIRIGSVLRIRMPDDWKSPQSESALQGRN